MKPVPGPPEPLDNKPSARVRLDRYPREKLTSDSISGWRTREPLLARIVFEAQLDSLATALDILASTLDRDAPLATSRHTSLVILR